MSHTLPAHSTSFVGRESELAEISDLLGTPECRLLTVTGPGGVGKTRLAIEAAKSTSFSNGAYFVPLQPLTSNEFMVAAIADSLNLTFFSEQDRKTQLLSALYEKHILLVLDNFEHLIEGATLLTEILEAAPKVKLLVTSRERLHLREEWVLSVGGLTFPKNECVTEPDGYSALQLFTQHARRAGYKPVHTDVASIARICQLVEGIPLAIELAAAWVRVMPCSEIAYEIERSLDILTTSTSNMPEKHRSMRATFEYSWKLLSDEERKVFRKLSVFRGGITREAAEQVTGASLFILSALVDRSLLRVDAAGRYSLQELLRQFADYQLENSGEAEAVHDAHCAYYAAFLHRLENDLKGPQQIHALDEIEAQLDNIRVSWRWAVMQGKASEIRQSLDALTHFYYMRSRYQEGAETFTMAVKRFGDVENELLGQLLLIQADFNDCQGLGDNQFEGFQKGYAILRQLGVYTAALAIGHFKFYLDEFGGFDAVQQIYEEYLAAAKTAGDEWGTAWALCQMGRLFQCAGRHDEALPYAQESLARFKALGDRWGTAWPVGTLAVVSHAQQHYEDAQHYRSLHLALSGEIGDRAGMLWTLDEWGTKSLERGEIQTSRRLMCQALALIPDIGPTGPTLMALQWTAQHLMAEGGHAELAVEVLELLNQYLNAPQYQSRQLYFLTVPDLDIFKSQLSPEAFAAAVQRGEASNFETMVAKLWDHFSVQDDQPTRDSESASHLTDQPLIDSLSERELEILQLIAEGLTSRDIASRIVLSVGTIHWYLKQIYSKLDVHSRTQAIARARALKLLA